jgi:hypothetical protein
MTAERGAVTCGSSRPFVMSRVWHTRQYAAADLLGYHQGLTDLGAFMRRIGLTFAGLSLLIAGCGGAAGASGEDDNDALELTVTTAPAVAGQVGGSAEVLEGVTLKVGPLESFEPAEFAAGFNPGETWTAFDIAVANKSTSPLDVSAVYVTGTLADGSTCTDGFDGDNGAEGAPEDAVAAGSSISFTWALSCPGQSGAPVTISVLLNQDVAPVEVSTKLP